MPIAHTTTGKPVVLTLEERFRHVYPIGKTGQGKSNFLKNLAIRDIEAGYGVWYFDPHGDDFQDLRDAIPPARVEQTVLYDLTDITHSFSHNPIADIPTEQIPVVAGMMAEGIRDIWHDAYSERMHSQILHGLITLMEKRLTTFADLPLLFYQFPKPKNENDTVNGYDWEAKQLRLRKRWLLSDIKNEPTRHFWKYEFPRYPPDAPVAILARIGQLLSSAHCSRILNHQTSAFSVKDAVANDRIVLVNLAKGIVGNTPASLMGAFLISELRREVMARAALPLHERRPLFVYIDEFHSLATLSLAQLLSESRKYRLGLVLANQYTRQLDPKVMDAIKGNVGTIVSFRVGNDDADDLIGEFSPFNNDSLTDQTTAHAILKQGIEAHPIITTAYSPTYSGSTDAAVHHSRRKYSRA